MTGKDIIRKSVFFIPSVAVLFAVVLLLGKAVSFGSSSAGIGFNVFIKKFISSDIFAVLMKTLPLLIISLFFTIILSIIFGLSSHSRIGDMWLSLLHGIFMSMPVFLFFFLALLLFSQTLNMVPGGGMADELSYILPVSGLSFFFALYLSFKIRYQKSIDNQVTGGNFKKTLYFAFSLFSQECGIFLSMLLVVEFFFYSGGIGYEWSVNLHKGNITYLSILVFYSGLIYVIIRYLFSLFAFFSYKKDDLK